MGKIPVGLQLFSVRGEVQNDLPGTLAKVAEIGYAGAEPWGYGGAELAWMGHSAADIRRMYDDHELICCGMHLQTGALVGDNLQRTIEMNQILGNKFLIIAGDKPRMESVAGVAELADILNSATETLLPLGMACGYHAHPFDFITVEGQISWNRLFSSTRPEVIMQMDIGNCANGDGDPLGTLKLFPGRTRTLHLKDYGAGPEAVIGEGLADWPAIFAACDELHPVEWYVIEEGHPGGLGFDIPARSLAALRAMGR